MSETPSPALPDDVHQLVADFFQRIPFNRMLGIRVASLGRERVVLDLPMKDELIGNLVQHFHAVIPACSTSPAERWP